MYIFYIQIDEVLTLSSSSSSDGSQGNGNDEDDTNNSRATCGTYIHDINIKI